MGGRGEWGSWEGKRDEREKCIAGGVGGGGQEWVVATNGNNNSNDSSNDKGRGGGLLVCELVEVRVYVCGVGKKPWHLVLRPFFQRKKSMAQTDTHTHALVTTRKTKHKLVHGIEVWYSSIGYIYTCHIHYYNTL